MEHDDRKPDDDDEWWASPTDLFQLDVWIARHSEPVDPERPAAGVDGACEPSGDDAPLDSRASD
jgi:hypothetical protein